MVNGPGTVILTRRCVLARQELHVIDHHRMLAADLAGHARHRVLMAAAIQRVARVVEVNAFQRRGEAIGIAFATDLAIGDDVEASGFLRADGEQGRVVLAPLQDIPRARATIPARARAAESARPVSCDRSATRAADNCQPVSSGKASGLPWGLQFQFGPGGGPGKLRADGRAMFIERWRAAHAIGVLAIHLHGRTHHLLCGNGIVDGHHESQVLHLRILDHASTLLMGAKGTSAVPRRSTQ